MQWCELKQDYIKIAIGHDNSDGCLLLWLYWLVAQKSAQPDYSVRNT